MLPEKNRVRKVWDFLLQVDSREASQVRKTGCRHCGGVLHSARYGRKPRGIPSALAADGECAAFRHSFCCAVCRRRTTPASGRVGGVVTELPPSQSRTCAH